MKKKKIDYEKIMKKNFRNIKIMENKNSLITAFLESGEVILGQKNNKGLSVDMYKSEEDFNNKKIYSSFDIQALYK